MDDVPLNSSRCQDLEEPFFFQRRKQSQKEDSFIEENFIFSSHIGSVGPKQGRSSGYHLPTLSKPELAVTALGHPQLHNDQKRTNP